MTSLIQALDQKNKFRVGENAHVEYSWQSNDLKEKIVKFYFQLVRSDDMKKLKLEYERMLDIIYSEPKKYSEQLSMLYKILANCRDCDKGKGEKDLTWMMLLSLWARHKEAAYYLFEKIVIIQDDHQLGSWADVKYFCGYIKNNTGNKEHPFILWIVDLFIYHLNIQWDALTNKKKNIPIHLLGKWGPREKSKYGWLHEMIAYKMHPEWIVTGRMSNNLKKAQLKCKITLTKQLTTLNKYLDTPQIKQCNGNWRFIDFSKVTSITMKNQKTSFQNFKNKSDKSERCDKEDRRQCAENFANYMTKVKEGRVKINAKRLNVYHLVRDALMNRENMENRAVIEEQWKENSKKNGNLGNIIAMVDTSGSMEQDECIPLYNAMGLGLRIAEKTRDAFKNRILTFDREPKWLQFDSSQSFCSKVYDLKEASWGMNTDFYKALDLILSVLVCNSIPPKDVEDLTLAVFSDMQIDGYNGATIEDLSSMFTRIEGKFKRHGYSVPHILFWNLRKTNGFPVKTSQKNVTMLSGYSEYLLNVLCEQGIEELKKITPYIQLKNILDNDRYKMFGEFMKNYVEQ